jgi:hypothetical protein
MVVGIPSRVTMAKILMSSESRLCIVANMAYSFFTLSQTGVRQIPVRLVFQLSQMTDLILGASNAFRVESVRDRVMEMVGVDVAMDFSVTTRLDRDSYGVVTAMAQRSGLVVVGVCPVLSGSFGGRFEALRGRLATGLTLLTLVTESVCGRRRRRC